MLAFIVKAFVAQPFAAAAAAAEQTIKTTTTRTRTDNNDLFNIRRRAAGTVVSILDVNLPLNDSSTSSSSLNSAQGIAPEKISTEPKLNSKNRPKQSDPQMSISTSPAAEEVFLDDNNNSANDFNNNNTTNNIPPRHDPVLATLAEQRPCGIVPAMIKTVAPTWLVSYPESGSQEVWRLVQAVTGFMTDEDVTNHGHALAGKAVLVKTHFPSHTPVNAFELFQSQLYIQKAILLIRNPVYAIPALHTFIYMAEVMEQEEKQQREQEQNMKKKAKSKKRLSSLKSEQIMSSSRTERNHHHKKHIPADRWIQWRNENFELELGRWVDQIRWWVFNYRQTRFDKLLLIPYERLTSSIPTSSAGVDELWKLAFFLRSVDGSIMDSMIPLEKFQCIWEFVVHHDQSSLTSTTTTSTTIIVEEQQQQQKQQNMDDHKNEEAPVPPLPIPTAPFTTQQLELIRKALEHMRDEYMDSYHELASVVQLYLIDVERLIANLANATN